MPSVRWPAHSTTTSSAVEVGEVLLFLRCHSSFPSFVDSACQRRTCRVAIFRLAVRSPLAAWRVLARPSLPAGSSAGHGRAARMYGGVMERYIVHAICDLR